MSAMRLRRRSLGGIIAVAGLAVSLSALVVAAGGGAASASDIGGRLRVEKRVQGDGAPAGPFGFHATCKDGSETVLDVDFTIMAGGFAAYHRLPVGAVCVVTETDAAPHAGRL